jgi:hypothetical protein
MHTGQHQATSLTATFNKFADRTPPAAFIIVGFVAHLPMSVGVDETW